MYTNLVHESQHDRGGYASAQHAQLIITLHLSPPGLHSGYEDKHRGLAAGTMDFTSLVP